MVSKSLVRYMRTTLIATRRRETRGPPISECEGSLLLNFLLGEHELDHAPNASHSELRLARVLKMMIGG